MRKIFLTILGLFAVSISNAQQTPGDNQTKNIIINSLNTKLKLEIILILIKKKIL